MSYYLGIEVKQRDDGIFTSQEAYAKEVLKRFNMENCNPISIPIEVENKLSRHIIEDPSDRTLFRNLMIVKREQRAPDFIKARADIVSVHCEQTATIHLHRTINQAIRIHPWLHSSSGSSKLVYMPTISTYVGRCIGTSTSEWWKSFFQLLGPSYPAFSVSPGWISAVVEMT
ncbi:hypothetical protein RJ639_000799 [Escallonia herrerae]|uniref:Uncharacterized protein n=1 Tax=Escallonia herrerae TaxID=1293975 RepID=A0AA88X9V0_9ASTE|nr:hypothetical protein RJ639_000799 [Escallonia herrerae]